MPARNDLLVVVPARGGSKRLPNKNLRQLVGKSLLARTADAIAEAKLDACVLLSTDDDAIAAEGKRLGWLVPFRRPAALATDEATTDDVVLHALDHFAAQSGGDPALLMVLQPTSPLRGGATLIAALELIARRDDADAVIGMAEINLPPTRLFLAGADARAETVSADGRRPVYVPNGAVYLVRTAAFRSGRSLYPRSILPLAMDDIRSIDIDTETDWQFAEAVLTTGLRPETAPVLAYPSLPGRTA